MILEFLGDNLDGDAWETLINECYRERYKDQGYQELPAGYHGDGGIEGFTHTGIVYQCYCPDKEFLENGELHKKYVDKMTKDIKPIAFKYSNFITASKHKLRPNREE